MRKREAFMRIAGRCGRCGEELLEGDFCYRIGEGYWCRGCIERAAVILTGERRRVGLTVTARRQVGRYVEREIGYFGRRK